MSGGAEAPWGVPDRWQCEEKDGEKQCVYGRDHKVPHHLFKDVTKPPMSSDSYLPDPMAERNEAYRRRVLDEHAEKYAARYGIGSSAVYVELPREAHTIHHTCGDPRCTNLMHVLIIAYAESPDGWSWRCRDCWNGTGLASYEAAEKEACTHVARAHGGYPSLIPNPEES